MIKKENVGLLCRIQVQMPKVRTMYTTVETPVSYYLNTITCKDGNSVSRELLSLMETVVISIAALCQVLSTGLLLGHLYNQGLTFIEHLLVPGTARCYVCYLMDFPLPTVQVHPPPSHPGKSGCRKGEQSAPGQCCSRLSP